MPSLTLSSWELWTSGILIHSLGVLLTAGGGGGGGVFVTILVFVAGFSGHEAVPLSKFIILWGAIATFLANTVRTPEYLDGPLIRSIAPMSLAGTLIGISLNGVVSESLLMGLLSVLLTCIFIRVIQMTIRKRKEESQSILLTRLPSQKPYEIVSTPSSSTRNNSIFSTDEDDLDRIEDVSLEVIDTHLDQYYVGEDAQDISHPPSEPFLKNASVIALIPIVVVFGVLSRCVPESPILGWILFWIPILCCFGVTMRLRKTESSHIVYPSVGLFSGVAAGLLGLGGGLIYTPFLLHMGIQPPIAIAVSSTCVLIASASTAVQYLLIGRVVSVAVGSFLAVFNICASISAVFLVEMIHKKMKPSALLYLVSTAVGVSALLAIIKAINLAAN